MKNHLENLSNKGVLIDSYGMLKPNISQKDIIHTKILFDLISLKHTVDALRKEGKHILYMPGSYDLVHAGHAFYIDQAIEMYLVLPGNENLTRADLVVLVLADDDALISSVKASKWIGLGGNEPFKRPLQSLESFTISVETPHWRLVELASIPDVDVVGFIPSPLEVSSFANADVIATQKTTEFLKEYLNEFKSKREMSERDLDKLENAIIGYERLIQTMGSDHSIITNSFLTTDEMWSIQAWQLFIHVYLGYGEFHTPFVRIISHNDTAYKDQVAFLMEVSGLQGVYIADESLISTTDLLAEYGHEVLLAAKLQNYN